MHVRRQIAAEKANTVVHRRRLDGQIDGPAGVQPNPATTHRVAQGILMWINGKCHGFPFFGKGLLATIMQYLHPKEK
jgi:hypothetical protein